MPMSTAKQKMLVAEFQENKKKNPKKYKDVYPVYTKEDNVLIGFWKVPKKKVRSMT